VVLANYQNFEKISEYILQSERRKIEEVQSFFSFIFENGQLRYLYMRHTWRTLHDTMIEISFRVGTLKYVPLLVQLQSNARDINYSRNLHRTVPLLGIRWSLIKLYSIMSSMARHGIFRRRFLHQ
jgi:hypothetical protein